MKKIALYLVFLFMLRGLLSYGQKNAEPETPAVKTDSCGTRILAEQLPAWYSPSMAANYSEWRSRGSGIKYVPIKFKIASLGAGQDAIDVIRVQESLDYANAYYRPSGIQFYMCGPPEIIVSQELYYTTYYQTVLDTTFEYGYINIYLCEGLLSQSASGVCGMYHNYELVSFDATYTCVTGSSFAHDLGHLLGLYHTHESVFGHELVNGSNCSNTGDVLCDTPADPGLSTANVDITCNYTGTALDSLGQPYSPSTHNLMSYSRRTCRDVFTSQQMNRMNYYLDSVRYFVKRYPNVFLLDSIPVYHCLGDGPVTLSGTPSGGTFSGPGVTGNQFHPSAAGPGIHMINYNYNGQADSSEAIDQYQYEVYFGSDTLTSVWQSLRAGLNGFMSRFDIMMQSDSAQLVNWSVYKGTGTGGMLVASGTQNIPASVSQGYVSFNVLTSYIPLIKDSVYTFSISTTLCPVVVRLGYSNQPPVIYPYYHWRYRDGTSSIPYRTIGFREWVWGVPGCDADFRYVFVDSCLTTGIHGNVEETKTIIYPNPATTEIKISCSEPNPVSIEIYDAIGNCVYHSTNNSREITIDIRSFSAGIYFVRVQSGTAITSEKFLKMQSPH